MLKLKHDKRSCMKPGITHGRAGDEVKLINNHQGIMIVEGPDGNRFAVNETEVTENDNEVGMHQRPVLFDNKVPAKRSKRSPAPLSNQSSFF